MSNLQKCIRIDIMDQFNDTSRYCEGIFIIGNPEFATHVTDIYSRKKESVC